MREKDQKKQSRMVEEGKYKDPFYMTILKHWNRCL